MHFEKAINLTGKFCMKTLTVHLFLIQKEALISESIKNCDFNKNNQNKSAKKKH